TRCSSSSPSPTTCCRPGTGRPTSSWCRAARSPSGWWPSKRRPAASRWWPRPWAACARWSSPAAPATWSPAATPPATRRRSPACSSPPSTPPPSAGGPRRWRRATAGPPPRPGSGASTPTSPSASPSPAPERPAVILGDTPRALDDDELAAVADAIDAWARRQAEELDVVDAVERDTTEGQRWFLRVRGEAKDVFTIWLELRQRTLRYETYVLPWPPA